MQNDDVRKEMAEQSDDDEFLIDEFVDDPPSHVDFEIATYPSDLTLSVIHEMWRNKDITIPSFQRNFVWSIKQSSLLIESFLLGLPVPQVFFYIDEENKNLVIDGQQRLMSIVFFFEGYFGVESVQGKRQVFRLSGLAQKSPYRNKRFDELAINDQRKLKASILRAVNIRQLAPSGQNTSMYHIFERLNTGGTPLKPQEIRNCVFHGPIVELLQDLNKNRDWRTLIGKPSTDKHQRDVEMLLRVMAISEAGDQYEKPMKEFLNKQMKRLAVASRSDLHELRERFESAVARIGDLLPPKPFHIRGPINLAALDSILGTLMRSPKSIPRDLNDRYLQLLKSEQYQESIFFNTSDAASVELRMRLCQKFLKG